MGILKSVKNIFGVDDRKKIYMPLDPETIKTNEIVKGQQQKIMSLESQLSRILAEKKEKLDKEKQKDKDSEFNKKLKEQKLDLDANRYGKIVKLSRFYKHLFENRKFRDKLEICDKNDETVLAKFGDFVILEGGKLGVTDSEGNLMSYGKSLNHVIYKPDSFENQARRGRFLIPMDKDGNWMEDIEYKELPEPLDAEFDEETGKVKRINWSRVKTSEAKKIIAQKMEIINSQYHELEMKDSVIIKLKAEIDDLNRALKINVSQENISQTALSKSLNEFVETQKRLGDLHSQITKLTELKATYENIMDRKDEIVDKILTKLELTGDSKFDRLKAELKDDLQFYKAILPEKVEIHEEPTPEPKNITQPGDVIKK